jgi:hypothetical protein
MGALADTTPRALERYIQLLREQAPHARLEQAAALTRTVRALAIAGIKQRYPAATDQEIRARLAARLYGREVASRFFGPLPDDAV